MIKEMPRAFTSGPIFMGNGVNSDIDCNEVRFMLERAFDIVGGLQQPCHCDRPCKCTQIEEEGWREVRRIARDLVMAITGDEIEFKEQK